MPSYRYKCPSCGKTEDVFQTISEHKAQPEPECSCGKSMKQAFGAVGVSWKCAGSTQAGRL